MDEQDVARFEGYRQALQQRAGSLLEMVQAEQVLLATDHLGYFAHWITPEPMPRRFDAHFFLAAVPDGQQASHDDLQASEGLWIHPAEALRRFQENEFSLVFATLCQLQELARFSSVKEAMASTSLRRVDTSKPILVNEGGRDRLYLPDDENSGCDIPSHLYRTRKSQPTAGDIWETVTSWAGA